MPCYLHDIEQLITSEIAEIIPNEEAENAISYTSKTSSIEICQHITLYAPLSFTVKPPLSRATATSITVPVVTTTTTILLLLAAAAIVVLLTLIQI